MAICISLMMGRLGSVVGANIVGLLLDNYCQLAFSMSGALLIRKCDTQTNRTSLGVIQRICYEVFLFRFSNSVWNFGRIHTEYPGADTNAAAAWTARFPT